MAAKSNLTNMVLVLGLTCLLCSAVLGGAYVLTKEPIEKAAAEKTNRAIAQVLPHFTDVEYNEEGHYFKATDGGNLVGYAIETTTIGFGGPLSLIVGVTPDGVVYNTSVLSHSETPGLGAKCTTDAKFTDQWRGFDPSIKKLSVTKDGGDVDAITASTITSRAYTLAVENALKVFAMLQDPSSPEAPQDDKLTEAPQDDNFPEASQDVILSASEESIHEGGQCHE